MVLRLKKLNKYFQPRLHSPYRFETDCNQKHSNFFGHYLFCYNSRKRITYSSSDESRDAEYEENGVESQSQRYPFLLDIVMVKWHQNYQYYIQFIPILFQYFAVWILLGAWVKARVGVWGSPSVAGLFTYVDSPLTSANVSNSSHEVNL